MKITAQEIVSLPDGKHEGVIKRIEYRDDPYKYTDVVIEEAKTKLELKYGCPTNIGVGEDGEAKTKLTRLLNEFTDVAKGEEYDVDDLLVGEKVTFKTTNKKTETGTFTNIVADTIRKIS